MASRSELHVVLGASGALGGAVLRQLLGGNVRIRAVNRGGRLDVSEQVEVMRGEGSDVASMRRVCDGADVVYHCINVPYDDWPRQFPPVTAAVIEGAAAAGAKLVFGDNLYMYGPGPGSITEDRAYAATGHKGLTRAAMSHAVIDAHRAGTVRATIGRAPDFFGPGVRISVLGERVFRAALAGGTADMLGNVDLLHTYTFIDDFARALVTLAQRDEALGQVWHVPSAETVTTRQMLEMIFAEAGTPMKFRAAPRWLVTLIGLVNPVMRELKEVLYSFDEPFVVDHSKFAAAFGGATTPHEQAIRHTLDWFRQNP